MGMRQTYVDTSNLSGRTVAGTLRRLLYYVGLHRRHIGIAFVALSIASLLNMVPPWALKIAVDDFIPQADAAGAARIAGAMMLIYLARGALNYLNFYLFARSSQTIVYQVSRDMFVRLVRHSMPSSTAPACRSRAATKASSFGIDPSRASEPARRSPT